MEDQQLLFCLNMQNEASKTSVLSKWTDTEWNELICQSERHGVSAYLNHRLKALEPTLSIPTPFEQRLREITLQNASRNIRLFHELGKTLNLLKDDGISIIVLKGAYLAEVVYGSIALRSMGDVDILVKKEDLHKTVTDLFQTGFHPLNEEINAYLKRTAKMQFQVLPESKHFFDLVHPEWKVKLDVHVSLTPEDSLFSVDTERLWNRALKSNVNGTEVLMLSPVDSLLYQTMHASFHHHYMFGLRPLVDISETIRRYRDQISWEDLKSRAYTWKAQKCAWLTLQFVRELLGAPVPEDVLTALEPGNINIDLLTWSREQIFSSQRTARSLPDDLIKSWKSRRLQDKAAAVFKAIFPSRKIMALVYPASPTSKRIYLYYLIRIKDLFIRWGGIFWRLLLRDKKTMFAVENENREIALEQWLTSVD
jgi:hypothetical protein